MCWQSKRFYWVGRSGGEQEGEGTQENCSVTWLAASGFMVMGLVSGWLWPIILIQSLSWWRMHRSAKMDASERDSGKWTDTRCLLLTFPELFPLVVAYEFLCLIRISCHKIIDANGYYGAWPGWAVSVSVLPLTVPQTEGVAAMWWQVSRQGEGLLS